jgi:hypothetical protein
MIVRPNRSSNNGGVLLVALVTCAILGITIGSYLSLVYNQSLSVTRAQAWNAALVVAEAGVEEAMAHLNSGVSTNNLAVNSWVSLGGGVYEKTNYIGDSFSVVDIKLKPAVTNVNPVIVATAYVPGPISRPKITRTVKIDTKPKSVSGIPGGLVVTTSVDLNGNLINIDSFNSLNPNYSTDGLYDPKKANDKAGVTTMSSGTNAINIGNAEVKGIVHTAPGGKITVGSGGGIGEKQWIDNGNHGVQDGHFADDAVFSVPDAKLPGNKLWLPPIPGKYKVNGVTYKYVLNNAAAWKLSNLDGSVYISSPDVILYVTDSVNLANKADQVHIAVGGSLSLYVGAPSVNLSGQGIINDSGVAKSFSYYGLPTNTKFTLGANASFTGTIYAPQCDFTLGGGGRNTYDYSGACVVKSVTMNGHFQFHYDEALEEVPAVSGYVAIAWDEL